MRKVKSLHCKGLCQASCGPIFFRGNERDKARQYCRERGLEFHELTQDVACTLLRMHATKNIEVQCPYLKDGRCSIYPVRPMICRIWGAVETMRCPFGCVPEQGYLTDREARSLIDE